VNLKNLFRFRKKRKDPLYRLEASLGYRFRDRSLLELAVTHRSYAFAVHDTTLESNERLEFLGDAVLGLVVSDFLFQKYTEKEEGELSKIKSLIISRKALKAAADEIGLSEFLLLSRSEEKTGGRERFSINTNTFEALIAAVYLDGGFKAASDFTHKKVLSLLEKMLKNEDFHNYKGRLLEHVQAKNAGVPQYTVTEETGPDHNKHFRISVSIQGKIYGEGAGSAKKDAEQAAAREALAGLKKAGEI